MLFNSTTFLVFFALVLALYYTVRNWRARKSILLASSYVFYAAWNPPFVLLLVISTVVDWFASKGIASATATGRRRLLLGLSMLTNLGMLGFFKYGDFMLENFVRLAGLVGVEYHPPAWNIVLPVGISFYTFQTLSYTADIYRGRSQPWHSFWDYALYVSFFPQLVAGPIVRSRGFLPQLNEPKRATSNQFFWGLSLLTLGLFQKIVLADRVLAPIVEDVYGHSGAVGFLDAWAGTFAFSGQIFFDFAGYSTCAIGVALCLGFALPDNFRFPYAAVGFSDFWRRWHISLSSWLRDYLYIPLGGNRKGQNRASVNVMITMLLGGLWHGAAWRFVIWGGLHGMYVLAERVIQGRWKLRNGEKRLGPVRQFVVAMITFLLVSVAWVFFRAVSMDHAFALLGSMAGRGGWTNALRPDDIGYALALTAALLTVHWRMRNTTLEAVAERVPVWARSALLAAMVSAIITIPGDSHAFIYFQF